MHKVAPRRFRTIERTYFKQGKHLISGCALPVKNRRVFEIYFSQCDFHPNCSSVKFVNCVFSACSGDEYLKKQENCMTL
jgi:hypothetical protein